MFVVLFAWIKTVEPGDFPPAPFILTRWSTIVDWDKYINSLQAQDRDSVRARTGALQSDLRRLHDVWNSDPIRSKLKRKS